MAASDQSQAAESSKAPSSEPKGTIVKLNVGGASFLTFRNTLIKSKYFASLLGDDVMIGKTLTNAGEIFIDRSGNLFRGKLYYLRTGSITTRNSKKLLSLQKEAEYYQLQDLADLIVSSKENHKQEANKAIELLVRDIDILNVSNSNIKKYIAIRDTSGETDVYQVVGIIDVLITTYCHYHRKHDCTECHKQKLILRRSSKTLG